MRVQTRDLAAREEKLEALQKKLTDSVGALVTVTAAGPFVTRFGGRVAFGVSAVLFGVAFLLAARLMARRWEVA